MTEENAAKSVGGLSKQQQKITDFVKEAYLFINLFKQSSLKLNGVFEQIFSTPLQIES